MTSPLFNRSHRRPAKRHRWLVEIVTQDGRLLGRDRINDVPLERAVKGWEAFYHRKRDKIEYYHAPGVSFAEIYETPSEPYAPPVAVIPLN